MGIIQCQLPQTMRELLDCLQKADESTRLIAGGTDLVVSLQKNKSNPVKLIDLSGLSDLNYIKKDDAWIKIGACTTFEQIAESPEIGRYAYALQQAARGVGSVQIRNRATIGGNIANASPAADSLPALVVLGANVVILDGDGNRSIVPVGRIATGVGKICLKTNQLITEIVFPLKEKYESNFAKIGSRSKVTISRLNMAISFKYTDNSLLKDVQICLGTLGANPLSLQAAALHLEGKRIDEQQVNQLVGILAREVEKAIPGRESLPYKKEAVKGLVYSIFFPEEV